MALARYANQRDLNEPETVETFKKLGASVWLIDSPCDLIVGYRGVTLLVEVKSQRGRPTPLQTEFQQRHKGMLHIVRTPEDVADLLASVTGSTIVSRDCR